jgi:SMI1 / KNR4 family (SUKH-1)
MSELSADEKALMPQVERIRRKLVECKRHDSGLSIFGADIHRYHVGPCLAEEGIQAFEAKHQLRLPECYRAFIKFVANGSGRRYRPRKDTCEIQAAAGPCYGVDPLGIDDDLDYDLVSLLKEPSLLHSGMSPEEWAELEESSMNLSSSTERNRHYAGLMTIGSKGCSFVHVLIVSGPHRGRVVHMCLDPGCQIPSFAPQANFLDWYEAWLDEVLSRKFTFTPWYKRLKDELFGSGRH